MKCKISDVKINKKLRDGNWAMDSADQIETALDAAFASAPGKRR